LKQIGIIAVFLWSTAGVISAAHGEDAVRVVVEGPHVPYERVEYSVEVGHGTIVARTSVTAAAKFGEESRIGLVTPVEWLSLLKSLRRLGASKVSSHLKERRAVRYTFNWSDGGTTHQWIFDEPTQVQGGDALRVINEVRGFVHARAGHIPYWDAGLLKSESGSLRIKSTPPGIVFIDGLSLNRLTPVVGLVLVRGPHQVQLVHPKTGEKWEYSIMIKAGRTTLLNVRLQ
jgi:hypothetical protein